MAQFIVNPRRAPRAPARCRAAVVSPAGGFEAETEDISARGCQVVSPRQVTPGDALELRIASDRVAEALEVAGTVSWVSEHRPWRIGVAFGDEFVPAAERWFERLVAATPGLGPLRRVPERIAVEAMVYLGPPPRFLHDFSAEEASLLRAIASGARIDELQARLRDRWPDAQRALFSLLARQAVTLSRGQAAHPDAWRRILTDVETSLAVEALDAVPPPVPSSAALLAGEPEPTPVEPLGLPLPPRRERLAPPTPPSPPWGADPHPAPGDAAPAADIEIAPYRTSGVPRLGAGWAHGSDRQRSAEAQALYDRAVAEIDDGSVNGAIALLRRALSLAPGDPDIAAALGRLAFKDRPRG